MRIRTDLRRRMVLAGLFSVLLGPFCSGCVVSLVGSIVADGLGAYSPSSEIEQTYYLGVVDPREQVPPSVYRVRVRGQASAISSMKFSSGWVQAQMIDSLQTSTAFSSAEATQDQAQVEGSGLSSQLQTGRRLVLFGPEGFREAPKDHRLVVVMGASPQKFFQAIDEALGSVAQVKLEQLNANLSRTLIEEMGKVHAEQIRLADLRAEVEARFSN